ncbi:MAG TPA: type II toxin-antitoxin system VapC family toxin [Thermoanaerobaculia bacterium]|nr:type II toxin-antitoxin system VapC family toxin [Thermoanaerobaculia bacterium]
MPEERTCVLDASALLAMLQGEPGGEVVQELLETAAISSVNWSEVTQKALDRQMEIEGLRHDLEALGLEIVPFTAILAETTAQLRPATRQAGLSLGDRACLALAAVLGLPAVTTDRIWPDLRLPLKIRVVR